MEKEVKQRMQEFLEETVKHYNSNNRSLFNGKCAYIPEDPSISEGCAIGRKLDPEYKELVLSKGFNTYYNVEDLFGKCSTPKIFEGFDLNFLKNVQVLHDTKVYWDEYGINQNGIFYVSLIISNYGLKPIQFPDLQS